MESTLAARTVVTSLRALGLEQPGTAEATAMAAELARLFGPAAMAVIHYGSRARQVDARTDSAYDFFIIVDNYRAAYRSLASETADDTGLDFFLSNLLSPNVHSLPKVPLGGRANKCGVLTLAALQRVARLEAPDHFVAGRLFQNVQILWSRDEKSRDAVRGSLVEIRTRTFDWGRSFLPEFFTVEDYCRSLLKTSFAGEVRPEASDRPAQLLDAQRDVLVPVYTDLLEELVRKGVLIREGDAYRQRNPPDERTRRRWMRYFARSKARGIARWGKNIVQYDGWLDYIVQKIVRHNEVEVELTERERRWPFIFLWPKVFLFFRQRSRWAVRR